MSILNGNSYSIARDVVLDNDSIPLTWWAVAPNFGDLLSPYLIQKITSNPVRYVYLRPGYKREFESLNFSKPQFSYFAIGSIISRVNSSSVVWGSGAFGTENENCLNKETKYLAVRGPLTRNLLRIHGGNCPEIYGDPALLLPEVFNPKVEKKYKIGVILRWSEREGNKAEFDSDVKKINLGSGNQGIVPDWVNVDAQDRRGVTHKMLAYPITEKQRKNAAVVMGCSTGGPPRQRKSACSSATISSF